VLLVALGASAIAQTPAPPSPAPGGVPAEVVPPKPPTPPAPGQATTEVPERKTPLSPATPTPNVPPSDLEKADVDGLSEPEVDAALAAIREKYVKPVTLSESEIKRATLQGLLSRLGPGAILQGPPPAFEPSPFRSEVLESRIGYVRLGDALTAQVTELDAALKKFTEQKLNAVVVDLRAVPPGADLEGSAEVSRRFAQKGKLLFSLKRRDDKEQIFTSKVDPLFRGLLVVLVDDNTAGSGEIIAAVLRAQAAAMVIGQRTEGKAAEFSTVPLGAGKNLHVAVAEVALPDTAPIFPGGVTPDLVVEVPQETTKAILKAALESGVTALITETERPRMNEAALVAGTNPELEAAIQAQRSRGERGKPPLRDAVLQRALDFVTTVSIYEKGAKGKK
jgi:hypothetical protein